MNELGDLEVFARVVTSRSMSGAGRHLGISPAMVSKRIKRLEDRLGTRLLQRTTRQLTVTEARQLFYDRVVNVIAGLKEAEQLVSGRALLYLFSDGALFFHPALGRQRRRHSFFIGTSHSTSLTIGSGIAVRQLRRANKEAMPCPQFPSAASRSIPRSRHPHVFLVACLGQQATKLSDRIGEPAVGIHYALIES